MKYSTIAVGMVLAADQQPSLTAETTIDVSGFTKPFFDVPVRFSWDVWELCAAMSHADAFRHHFRIKSILAQSKIAIKNAAPHLSDISFEIRLRTNDSYFGRERHRLLAKAVEIDGAPALLLKLDKQPRLVEVCHD